MKIKNKQTNLKKKKKRESLTMLRSIFVPFYMALIGYLIGNPCYY